MTDKKALENFFKTLCEYETDTNNKESVYPYWYKIIFESLDRKEQLEKENQELLVNKNFAQGVALKYKKAIEILKDRIRPILVPSKGVYILRTNFHIDKENTYYVFSKYLCNQLTQEEYELLKEVLE